MVCVHLRTSVESFILDRWLLYPRSLLRRVYGISLPRHPSSQVLFIHCVGVKISALYCLEGHRIMFILSLRLGLLA